MRKIHLLLTLQNITILTVSFICVIILSNCQEDIAKVELEKVAIAPSIDGKIDKVWDTAQWTTVERQQTDSFNRSDLSARFKVLYDNNNFYLLFDVIDDIPYRRPLPKSALETRFEFYCPAKDKKWPDKNDCIVLSFDIESTQKTPQYDNNYMFVYDYDSVVIAGTIKLVNEIILRQKKHSRGYLMEISVPFKSLNLLPHKGLSVATRVVVMDNDNNVIIPGTMSGGSGTLIWGAKEFGRFILTE